MTHLALAVERQHIPEGMDEVFLWDGSATDSFKTALGPTLDSLGPVSPMNADFVRIALAAYSADHTVLRESRGSKWNVRDFTLTVPVSNPDAWAGAGNRLSEAIGFLTGDRWTFEFHQLPDLLENESLVADTSLRTVLVSGGADSACGAIFSASTLSGEQTHSLVSHASSPSIRKPQKQVGEQLESLFPGRQAAHHRIFLGRGHKRLDGTDYPVEPSSRSRSLLFLALGLSVASQSKSPLWIPENGFASLNPPLGPERLGALSTRTTQPWFLWRISEILKAVGAHGIIENPFQLMTKGEMFEIIAEIVGSAKASEYLSSTNSCSHTDQNFHGVASGTHCGVCFGCIVRRASFKAADILDTTRYLSNEARFDPYTSKHSVVEAAKDFANSAISNATIMIMPLPPTLTVNQAKDLCERGQAEIRSYFA
jgi:hypothetical protein